MINLLTWREMIAEVLLTFDVILSLILIRYLWYARQEYDYWWKRIHIQGAAALLVLLSGHAMIRGWSVATFINLKQGGSLFELENQLPIAFIGTIVAVVGLCWCIRIFTPDEWGEKGWIVSCFLALAFVLMMRLVV